MGFKSSSSLPFCSMGRRGNRRRPLAEWSSFCLLFIIIFGIFRGRHRNDFSSPQPSSSRSKGAVVDKAAIEAIQRECLRAYPKPLLSILTKNTTEVIPDDVDEEPQRQMAFLTTEHKTTKGLFYPSLLDELLPPMRSYISEGTRFLDLGSGDGRMLFVASALGAHATGVEYDGDMIKHSKTALSALSSKSIVDPNRINIIQGDFFDIDFSEFDVLFYFDIGCTDNIGLKKKIEQELAPNARLLIAHEQQPFPFSGLEFEGKWSTYPTSERAVVTMYKKKHDTASTMV
mmetsp:Transcript_11326/g.24155  ORF Transcript_11326/g.24155 Transcript_11326/m.24155 type:complete len:287 (+) Transcript_11326:46-906(+)